MLVWLIAALALILAVTTLVIILLRRRSTGDMPEVSVPITETDFAARQARRQAMSERGSELIDRRVVLDSRRGTLGGDDQLYDAIDQLEARFHGGEITENEYETEKVRLLGG